LRPRKTAGLTFAASVRRYRGYGIFFRTRIGHGVSRRVSGSLSNEFCKTVLPPPKGNKLYRCGAVRGLALRVTSAGHKSFVFCYSDPAGRERRMTIGEFGPWSLAAAKKRLEELRREVDAGGNPIAQREERRTAPSLTDLWEWYSASELKKLSEDSRRNVQRDWSGKIRPVLGAHTKLADLTRADIQRLVDAVTEKSGETAANRCHSYIRRMLNLAVLQSMVDTNVAARAVHRHQEYPRQRFLTHEELERLSAAVEANLHLPGAAAVKLLMLTGARRGEVLSMRWADVDLASGVWVKPPSRTKQRRVHRVPLSDEAVETLRGQKASSGGQEFVFPSGGRQGHLVAIKRVWSKLCRVAAIDSCRFHDLRHSFASVIVSNGGNLELIGGMLGHSQPSTTKRYAHFFDAPMREAAELVSRTMSGSRS
jgi:integrase